MSGQARLLDTVTGICYCHDVPKVVSGRIVTASLDVITNYYGGNIIDNSLHGYYSGSARMFDIVIADCGHIGVIVSGDYTHHINNFPSARLGDIFCGCYNGFIITSSLDTISSPYPMGY